MRLEDFDFALPEAAIALRPARPRDAARLLVVDGAGRREDRVVAELPALLAPGDLLVLNDTKVIAAALVGLRPARAEGGGGPVRIGLNLHARDGPARWRAFARPAKRLRAGDRLAFPADSPGALAAEVASLGEGGEAVLDFDRSGAALDAALGEVGETPLPPYIASRRPADGDDRADYQTMFARVDGSVAAPTAGLHFTPELLAHLAERGVETARVTLHVGAGTFLPVTAADPRAHRLHPEWRELGAATAAAVAAARARGGRVVPVGTTSLRTLESAAIGGGLVAPVSGETGLFILPGHRFAVADGLLTNFHLPRSSLFMLVCAFMGTEIMRAAYAHAIAAGYRFYSYGDACLLLPGRG